MNKKTLSTIISAVVMVVLAFGVIVCQNVLENSGKQKTERIDLAGFVAENAALVTAERILGSGDATDGYAVTVSSVGFNSETPITMKVTFNAEKTTITQLEIIEHDETAGLGAKVAEDSFLSQFTDVVAPVYTADMEEAGTSFDQITGATLSSKAIATAINASYEFISSIAE